MVNNRILIIGVVITVVFASLIVIGLQNPSDDNTQTSTTTTTTITTSTNSSTLSVISNTTSTTITITTNTTTTTSTTKMDNGTQILQQGNVTIYFIDVGQGDAIFVDTPDKDVLIDGGVRAQGDNVSNFLFSLGIVELDYLIATHPDADHIGGLITVMEQFNSLNYPIHQVLDNGQEKSTQTYRDYNQLAESIGIIVGERYQVFQLDLQTEMMIISPPNPQLFSDVNENSIVVMIRYKDVSFLLTGDMEENSEKELVESELNLDATILKVGHHGSLTSTTDPFLSKVTPEVAVISVGTDNNYGHPNPETLERLDTFGVETYRTDQHGTISITTDGINYSVTTETKPIIIEPPQIAFDIVLINEIEANPEGTDNGNEWIELYNPTDKIIDVSGWIITTHGTTNNYIIPEDTTIFSHNHLVISFSNQFLDNTDESIILSNIVGQEVDRTPLLTDEDNDNNTWQRQQDGSPEWIFKLTTKESIQLNLNELFQDALISINEDRISWDVNPVELGNDFSAQEHADDLADMCVLSHWDSGGMKPYMRYSLAGGEGVVAENAAFLGWIFNNLDRYKIVWTQEEILAGIINLEYLMMYDDAHSDWGHRDNIINPTHNKVSIGIAWNEYCLVYIQHFEDDYIDWIQYPLIESNNTLGMSGTIQYPISHIESIHIAYDPIPTSMNATELDNTPNSYSLGDWAGVILPPLPEGWFYPNLDETDIVAQTWLNQTINNEVVFDITANIQSIIAIYGDGVYTIAIWALDNEGNDIMLTTISIFIET